MPQLLFSGHNLERQSGRAGIVTGSIRVRSAKPPPATTGYEMDTYYTG